MRILICDDHALFREGLELVLAQLDPAAALTSVADGEAALELVAADDRFDLVLLDLGLPGMSGLEALETLRHEYADLPVVVLSASENPKDVRSALERGASGFIPKSTSGSLLLGALRCVLEGSVYVPEELAAALETPASAHPVLTTRQVEVLRLLARGLTNREIAEVLQIGEETAKSHVKRIYDALDVSNRTEAAMRMRELGIEE